MNDQRSHHVLHRQARIIFYELRRSIVSTNLVFVTIKFENLNVNIL